ncbi:LytR/AlgR family response regulator transcription factor [Undibacterium terreum]|uniref:DNA-binding response regulator n=1 Tax=Undibacterium terreum TaxID=1224302 RepID=A0A916XQN0_9BURK|nr:LytTR family DNA-binding domain-containing protein [Undibacterium terreum]GGC95916.1 DNA-binding response regulator [Undibacterium terreum]
MRALIVDDERLARAELRRLLAAHPEVIIAGEAATAAEAHRLIEELQPELIFLDIQMPGGSGFDLLAALDHAPQVIFTTAFDTYAIKAFEVSALDYLLKPVTAARLASALHKTAPHPPSQAGAAAAAATTAGESKLFIKDGDRCWFVSLPQIRLFESEGNYTRVYFDNQQPLMLRSLTQLEQKLEPSRFVRASRRHIVNLDHVQSITASANGGLDMHLGKQQVIEMSRRRAAEFKNSHKSLLQG